MSTERAALIVWVFAAIFTAAACTRQQQQRTRAALDLNLCVTTIALRHIDAGEDVNDPVVWAVVSTEIIDECVPKLHAGE